MDSLYYEEVPIENLDWQVHQLRMKDIASITVLWKNHKVEEATWKSEEDIKFKYPFLFFASKNRA